MIGFVGMQKGEQVGDLISRQAAIDALDKRFDSIPMEQTTEILLLRKDLRNLPSVEVEPTEEQIKKYILDHNLTHKVFEPVRRGKWMEMGTNADGTHNIKCGECGAGYKTKGHANSILTKAKYKFCPRCGAKMNTAEM